MWPEPSYDVFDPDDLPAWIESLREAGGQFWVGADRQLPKLEPAFAFFSGRNRPVFSYATATTTSVRSRVGKATSFKYEALDATTLKASSKVTLVPIKSEHMSFLKDKYLALGLEHVTGMYNVAVYIDGALAGGFIYSRDTSGRLDVLYLLSDFSVSRDRRLSKLIAMLAASEVPVRAFDRVLAQKSRLVMTTAFTDKPVSMKYRGIYELHARKTGFLQYRSEVRSGSPDEVYRDWWRRFGGHVDRQARD